MRRLRILLIPVVVLQKLLEKEIMTNSLRKTMIDTIALLLEEELIPVPELQDSTVLLETGLDSLAFAVLVVRLEESLGYDPDRTPVNGSISIESPYRPELGRRTYEREEIYT